MPFLAAGMALELVRFVLLPSLLAGARGLLGAIAVTFDKAPFQLLLLGGVGAFLWARFPKDWSLK